MTDQLREDSQPGRLPAGSIESHSLSAALTTVWATGQVDVATQLRRGGYAPATARIDPNGMHPAIAAHAIAAYTRPGDLVLDPDCGAGTAVVEALRNGRNAIGLAGTPRTWQLARANVSAAKAAGAAVDGMVLVLSRRPNTLATAHAAGFVGRVDLVVTSLRIPTSRNTSSAAITAVARLRALLADCRMLLRPGGHVVISMGSCRSADRFSELLDLPAHVIAAGTSVDLMPRARCVALTGAVHVGHVRPWDTRAQRRAARRAHAITPQPPLTIAAHHTVLVFGVMPTIASAARSLPNPLTVTGARRIDLRLPELTAA